MRSGIVLFAATLAGISIPAFAQASSPDAWKEFNAQVEQKCAEAAADMFRKPKDDDKDDKSDDGGQSGSE